VAFDFNPSDEQKMPVGSVRPFIAEEVFPDERKRARKSQGNPSSEFPGTVRPCSLTGQKISQPCRCDFRSASTDNIRRRASWNRAYAK
jgi:hypothetical protein